VDVFGRYEFRWRDQVVAMPLAGKHAVADAMIALGIADLLGVAPKDAVRGLVGAVQNPLRGEVRRFGSLTVIVDCYNANPQSVRASLGVLEGQAVATRRVAVLGTMLELGEASARLHREVLGDALARPIDLVVATGAFGEAASTLQANDASRLIRAEDWKQAYPLLRERLVGDEVVLLKASRGVALEGILPMIERDF
jgi:UDP-N-acetylmuramoyl-tripeptide--D-alanyl-D-alanine ligase